MASIVMGVGTSHSPLLLMPGESWALHTPDLWQSDPLHNLDGRRVSYAELLHERGGKHKIWCSPSHLAAQSVIAQQCLQRIAAEIARTDPDVVLVIGDDHNELLGHENLPALSVYYGADVAMLSAAKPGVPDWLQDVHRRYGMGTGRIHKGAPAFARALIAELIGREVDVGAVASVPDPVRRGFGHAFGFVAERLLGGRPIPMLPVLLNTHFPPNIPTARRCYEIGRKLRRAIEACPFDLRVAIIGSGGLSHFVCEEALDHELLNAFRTGDIDMIGEIPRAALKPGTSEILTWIVMAGAVEHLKVTWDEYLPVYQTPAGTGIGLAFMSWGHGTPAG